MNIYRYFLKNISVIGLGSILAKGVVFILIPLQTLAMSTSEFGTAEMIYNIVNLSVPICTFGLSEAVMRFSMDNEHNKKKILNIALSIPFVGAIILLFALLVGSIFFKEIVPYIFYILATFLAFAYKDIFMQYIKGIGEIRLFAISGIVFSILLFIFNYGFVYKLKYGVNGYLLSQVLSNSIVLAMIFFILRVRLRDVFSFPDIILLRNMANYGLPLVINQIAWWLTNSLNRYLLAFYLGIGLSGIYSAAVKITLIFNTIILIFQQAWQISAIREFDENNIAFFSNVYNFSNAFIMLFTGFIILFSNIISSILFQGGFGIASKYVPALLITSGTFSALPVFWSVIYSVTKNSKGVLKSTILGAFVCVALDFWLIPKFGIFGAAIASGSCFFVVLVIRIIEINKILRIKIHFMKNIFALIILGMQSLLLHYFEYCYVPLVILQIALMAVYKKEIYFLLKLLWKNKRVEKQWEGVEK